MGPARVLMESSRPFGLQETLTVAHMSRSRILNTSDSAIYLK